MMPVGRWFIEMLAKDAFRRGDWVRWLNIRLSLRGSA
jgi:hypothetical protein